jgi:hypothetical protein
MQKSVESILRWVVRLGLTEGLRDWPALAQRQSKTEYVSESRRDYVKVTQTG